jgi:AraC-like DNA-binding protein
MMPGMDGRALVRALRDSPETEFLSIVLLTAQADSEQKIAGLEGGADDYLVKPFEMRELDVRVRNLIAARQRLRLHLRSDVPQAPASRSQGVAAVESLMSLESLESLESLASLESEHATVSVSAEERDYVERVTRAIQAGLADPDFGVQELADAVFQDRTHLFRRVRKATGLSPSDLLRRARIECGARLLAAGNGTVADVAFTVGFRSVSHFCRSFNAQYGMTPATYRATALVNAPSEVRGVSHRAFPHVPNSA